MATPPFDILEAKPADADIVSQHPADERSMRDIVESWMNIDHDSSSGHHAIGVGNTAARDAITDWVVGSLWLNTATSPAQWQHVVSVGPVVWANTLGGLDTVAGDVRYVRTAADSTITALLRLARVTPTLEFEETDRTIEVDGLWALVVANGDVRLHRNTAVAGDFSTFELVLSINETAFEYKGNTIWHAGSDGAGSGLDADLLDGSEGSVYLAFTNFTGTISDAQHGNRAGGALHVDATASADGFATAAQITKLNAIESAATADQSGAEILAALLPVDGAGSGLDADKMDGVEMSGAGNQLLSASGFQVFPGGLILNWGITSVAANTDVLVTLQKAYPTAHLNCIQSPGELLGTGINESNGGCLPASTTQIRIQNINDVTNDIRWFSVGH